MYNQNNYQTNININNNQTNSSKNNYDANHNEYHNKLIKNLVCTYSGVSYKDDLIGICYEYTNQILSFSLISLKSFNQGYRSFDVWIPLFFNQENNYDRFQDSINNFIKYKSNTKSFSFFLLETCIEIVKRCNNNYNTNNNNSINLNNSNHNDSNNKLESFEDELFTLFEIYLCFNKFYLKYEYFKKLNIIYVKSIDDLSKQLLLLVGSNNWDHLFKQSVSLLFQRDHNDSFFKEFSLESIQLIMMQYYLLKQLSHKTLEELNAISPLSLFNQFNNEIKSIQKINNLKDFFNYLELIPVINNSNSNNIYNLTLLELNYIIKSNNNFNINNNNGSNNSSNNNSGDVLKNSNFNIIKVDLSNSGSLSNDSGSGNNSINNSINISGSSNSSTGSNSSSNNISISRHIESEWKKKVQIGKGAFSTVYKAKKINGIINGFKINNYCAIKVISKDSFFKDEIYILEKLNKLKDLKYFVYYYGYGQDEDNYYIYMEYFSGSSIGNLIKDGNKFLQNDIQLINYELVNALSIIHDNNIIHRDLKCDNILINPSFKDSMRSFQIKIIDFGLSKQIDQNSKYYSNVGSEYFIAPEVKLQNGMASRKSDIWSLGCILIEMVGGSLIPNSTGTPIIPNDIPDELRNFIQCCLIIDPDKRFNSSQLKLHSFYYSTFNKAVVSRESFFPKNNLLRIETKYIPYIPISLRNLSLDQLDEQLEIGSLPNTIVELTLNSYNKQLVPGLIPSSVEILTMNSYNQLLEKECIPYNVRKLKMDSFNQPLEIGSIPTSVVSLSLFSFNQPLHIGMIPKNVQVLEFNSFNQRLYENCIPQSVEKLNIESMTAEISDNGIPESVTHLSAGDFTLYDLPESIETLCSSFSFKQQLRRKDIPSSVVNLVLNNYNLPIQSGLFRKNVAALTLDTVDFQHIESLQNLSEGIFVLSLGSKNYDFEDIKKYLNRSISKLIVNGKTQCTYHDNSKYTRKSRPLNNFFISSLGFFK